MPYPTVYDPSVAASGHVGASIGSEGTLAGIIYRPMRHPHFVDEGLGQVGLGPISERVVPEYTGPTIDQIAQRTMHDLAVRIFAAKTAGDFATEQSLRLELARVSAIFRGFATEAEKRAAAEEAAEFDPIGLKAFAGTARTTAQVMLPLAAIAGLAFLVMSRKGR